MRTAQLPNFAECIPLAVVLVVCALALGRVENSLNERLKEERLNLQIGRATQRTIQDKVDVLNESCSVDPELVASYEQYLDRVEEMVTLQERTVAQMEMIYAARFPALTSQPVTSNKDEALQFPIAEATDPVASLDEELDASLASFDGILLREIEKLAEQMDELTDDSDEELTALAERAAEAAREVREKQNGSSEGGEEGESDQGETGEVAGTEQAAAQADGQEQGQAGTEGAESASAEGTESTTGTDGSETVAGTMGEPGSEATGEDTGGASGETGAPGVRRLPGRGGSRDSTVGQQQRVPPTQRKRPDSYDDDIVAKQLREAAEKETDPVIKEKLWKEYEDYKSNARQ